MARYAFTKLGALYAVLPRVYALGMSLPDGPLQTFIDKTKDLPRTPEAQRLVVQRVGQDIFRERLLTYWGNRCPLTGIQEADLLRASHIKPWVKCDSDAERLDVHKGLLLSALWDAAFDSGLATFEDDGTLAFSQVLSDVARAQLLCQLSGRLALTGKHRVRLVWHRNHVFIRQPCDGLVEKKS
jgi:predicted restriction endonuclease